MRRKQNWRQPQALFYLNSFFNFVFRRFKITAKIHKSKLERKKQIMVGQDGEAQNTITAARKPAQEGHPAKTKSQTKITDKKNSRATAEFHAGLLFPFQRNIIRAKPGPMKNTHIHSVIDGWHCCYPCILQTGKTV